MTNVFVYGTLKKGYGNNRLLANSLFCGKAITNEEYLMLNLGYFPGVRKNDPLALKPFIGNVAGELYQVDAPTLESLDRLEGNGHFYNREIVITLLPENDAPVRAWMYFLMTNPACPVIPPNSDGVINWQG